ncbi:MAG: hypothetical protein ACFFG0_04030 [Candidatus Thorarchaeota archaeon]
MASNNIECKGCTAYSLTYNYCDLEFLYEDEYCPCLTCLVKCICISNSSNCEILEKFANKQQL